MVLPDVAAIVAFPGAHIVTGVVDAVDAAQPVALDGGVSIIASTLHFTVEQAFAGAAVAAGDTVSWLYPWQVGPSAGQRVLVILVHLGDGQWGMMNTFAVSGSTSSPRQRRAKG